MVRQFADEQILPNAEHYDAADEYPEPIVEQMKELGLFGVTIPEEYGGMGLDLTTYVMIVEELSRGWISISGVINTHFIGSYLLQKYGTDEQKQRWLPRMATGEIRAAFSLSEPELGSDVQAIKTSAKKLDDGTYEINGQKMWVTNGLHVLAGVRARQDRPDRRPAPPGFTCFVAEKEAGVSENTGDYAGLTVPPKIKKLGYKGVESTELVFDGYRCPAENILGGEDARPQQGLRPDDGRARGRPRQRRRPRRRHRPARARARAALLPGAQDLRHARSPSTRRSSSSSPTWRRRSRRPGC